MASQPRVGVVSESEFIRDATLGFFIGVRYVESSPHRECFYASHGQLIPKCAICNKWKACSKPFREVKL